MILLFILSILFIIFIIALIISPFYAIGMVVSDKKITDVKILDTVGKKVSFLITYNNGKTKIETVKIGSSRYDVLRVKCENFGKE